MDLSKVCTGHRKTPGSNSVGQSTLSAWLLLHMSTSTLLSEVHNMALFMHLAPEDWAYLYDRHDDRVISIILQRNSGQTSGALNNSAVQVPQREIQSL